MSILGTLKETALAALDLLPRRAVVRKNTGWNDPAWSIVENGYGEDGANTASGIFVTDKVARSLAAWWRGINLVSNSVGRLTPFTHRRLPNDTTEKARDHPSYRLNVRQPGPNLSPINFRKTMQAWAMGRGNAYAYIFRDDSGNPDQLLPLSPERTEPMMVQGKLWYITSIRLPGQEDKRQIRALPAADVLHIRGLSSQDGILGDDVITLARDTIGLGKAAEEHGGRLFSRGARPQMVLEHPFKLSPKAKTRIVKGFEAVARGLDRAHSTVILDEGLKANAIGMTSENAQFLETRQMQNREVANFLGIPPYKLGDDARTSFNSLEQESRSYLEDAVEPWLVTWEQECMLKLLTPAEQERETHYIEFNRRALVSVDLEKRFAGYQQGIQSGWLRRNEARRAENLPPGPPELDEFLEPLNMAPAGSQTPAPAPAGKAARQALLRNFIDRMGHRVAGQAGKYARRGASAYWDWVVGGQTTTDPDMESLNRSTFEEQGAPIFECCKYVVTSDTFFQYCRNRLLEAAECQPEELVDRVALAEKYIREELPGILTPEGDGDDN